MFSLLGCAIGNPDKGTILAGSKINLPNTFAAQGDRPYGEIRTQSEDTLFGILESDQLQALIHEALKNNNDLNATARRLDASRLLLKRVTAQQLPRAELGVRPGRTQRPGDTTNSSSARASLSWELDLWGKLADQSKAAKEDYRAQQLDFQAAQNSISGQVARSWLLIWALNEVIEVENERIAILQKLENITETYYREGLSAFDDVGVVRIELQSARAGLDELEEQLRSAKRALEIILSRYPDASLQAESSLPNILQPKVTMPAVVMAERPDIQASFTRITSQLALSDAAYKAMLPSITLGIDLVEYDLFSSSNDFMWSIVGDITQPLFDGGLLLAEAEASSIEAQARVYEYKQTVLRAMQEVEQTISEGRSLARRYDYYKDASDEAAEVLKDYTLRYLNGLISILDLLQVQEEALDLKSAVKQVRAARLDNRIVLGLALGLGVQSQAGGE